MKGKALLIGLAVLLIAVTAGATLAYFTSRDTVANVFTVGSVKIKLEEAKWDQNAEHIIVPGAVFQKDPTVTNTGSIDAYVRIHVTVSDYAALSAELTDLTQLFAGRDGGKWTAAGIKTDSAADAVTYSYYYSESLKAGESTVPLFTSVKIPSFLSAQTMEALKGELTVTVTADAIQAETFTGPADAFQAFDVQMSANP